jgi:hypothetical protein
MNETSNSFVLELSSYTQPSIVEDSRNAWVEYGEDNNYYSWLIDRYRNSPTNNAVINNMSKLIYGKGLNAKDANRKPNEYAQMKMLFGKTCLRSVILDLKLMGSGAFQCIKSKGLISKVEHLPMNLLRPAKCNKDGIIEGYWYSDNWEDVKKFVPVFIPCLGTSTEDIEVLVFGNYSVGRKYFSSVDYEGALDYCVLEERIAEYLINEVENGFSGTKVVNFNNGVPGEEQQRLQSSKVLNKLTGSRGQKVIVSFNNNETQKTTVDDIPLNDAPQHYEYLSTEARNKILVGHNITSPMLVGVTLDGSGFSSSADEIEVAAIYFYNTIVNHFQELVTDACDTILAINGISLDLFFERKSLTTDSNVIVPAQDTTTLSLSSAIDKLNLDNFGENAPENWVLIDEFEVDYDTDDSENALLSEKPKEETLLSKIWNFISSGDARPNITSKQDETIDGIKFVTRYKYAGETSENTRAFCKNMIKANKIYRKEDIINMGSQVVNEGWGPEGTDLYSVWYFKGGGACHHRWNKQVYAVLSGTALDLPNQKQIAQAKAKKYGYEIKNESLVSTRPIDMPYNGFLPTNKRFN